MSVAYHGGPEVGVGVPGWDPSGDPQEGPGPRERGQEGGGFLEGEALREGVGGLLREAWPAWLGARGRGRRPGLQQLSPHLGQGPAPPYRRCRSEPSPRPPRAASLPRQTELASAGQMGR